MRDLCCHIIVNQHSGNGRGKKTALDLEKLLLKNKVSYFFYMTQYPGHAITLTKEVTSFIKNEDDRIWVIGGDGTLHEVITGLKKLNLSIPIGYFPSGTGNDFSRSLGLPKDLEDSFENLLSIQTPSPIECFIYEGIDSGEKGIGLNSFGIGFDAKVTQISQESDSKKRVFSTLKLDHFIYFWSITRAFKNRKTFEAEISVDGKKVSVSDLLIVAVMNHPYFGGGIKIDPESSANSNELAVMMIKNFSASVLIKLLWKVITDGSHIYSAYFQRIPGTEITIKTKTKQLAQVDGELIEEANQHLHFQMSTFLLWK